mmetsp:Transcript_28295/g.84706  ORF Transcript_28295/g.84706 Transcript_28295/m.84706 type:complete len:202 (-) Transcript_28295:747-1352(-)
MRRRTVQRSGSVSRREHARSPRASWSPVGNGNARYIVARRNTGVRHTRRWGYRGRNFAFPRRSVHGAVAAQEVRRKVSRGHLGVSDSRRGVHRVNNRVGLLALGPVHHTIVPDKVGVAGTRYHLEVSLAFRWVDLVDNLAALNFFGNPVCSQEVRVELAGRDPDVPTGCMRVRRWCRTALRRCCCRFGRHPLVPWSTVQTV